jgi:hypothetical protein
MKAYERMEVRFHLFSNSALGRVEWSDTCTAWPLYPRVNIPPNVEGVLHGMDRFLLLGIEK